MLQQAALSRHLAGPAVMAALARLAPAGTVCAGGAIDAPGAVLYAPELAALAGAVPRRRREFTAGRHYARRAMATLQLPAQAVPVLPSRAPAWPQGIVGSITHTADLCAVLLARADQFWGVGLDLEADDPLAPDLARHVCTGAELAWIGRAASAIDLPKLLFVIKEAVYKLYAPLTGHFLDFDDLTVHLDPQAPRFSATLAPGCPAVNGRSTFTGSYGAAGGHLFAVGALPRPGAGPHFLPFH